MPARFAGAIAAASSRRESGIRLAAVRVIKETPPGRASEK
jgi:hypothetical protein